MIDAVLSYDGAPAEEAAIKHDQEFPIHHIEVIGYGFIWMCRNCPAQWSREEGKTTMRGKQ